MSRDLQEAEVSRVPEQRHLPSGQVTFLFTDIESSTRLARILGPDYRRMLTEHRLLLHTTLSAGSGSPLFTEGDSFFVAFPDAGAALVACAEAQRMLAAHEWPAPQARPLVRMGLHTGYAQPQGGEYASPEVHRAARVAAAAHGGQVLCSAATARHGRAALPDDACLLDLGLHQLRGFDDRERLYQLVAPGLERHFPRPRTQSSPGHNLPSAVTPFVGRRQESARLATLLDEHRLVTIVGPGGAGKTRLAVEVAEERVARYPDGVWFVDLAPVTEPGLVAVETATALGLRPEPGRPVVDTLADYAAQRRFLLVLDTCDAQLGAASVVVAELLTRSRGVQALVTCREPLGVPGEVVWRIPPLSLRPAPDGGPSDAVALLLHRTEAARGGRPAEAGEVAHLERVAARLAGLPLALELAAARLRALSAGQLADRVDSELPGEPGDVLGALDAGRASLDRDEPRAATRHATMQATMNWSYRTLDQRSARLLRWLSVFAGPVDLPAVRWLLEDDPLEPLAVLVDKSLVQAEPGASGTAYRLLDPIRAYAARQLAQAGEEREVRERHVAWSLHALRRVRLGADGRAVTLSLYALDPLAVELRTALRWTVHGGSARQGLRLASGLDQWWRERGLAREGRLWLFRLYGRVAETGEQVPDAELAAAYHMHSMHAGADGEYAEQLRFAQRAETAARLAGDPGLLVRVLGGRGASLLDLGRPAEAELTCREVVDWAAEHGVAGEALLAVYRLAQLYWRRGALDEAATLLAGARAMEAAQPVERGRRDVDMLLGMVALARGDLVGAHEHLLVALRSRMSYGFHSRACESVTAVAARCVLGEDWPTAARLFGAADAARARLSCHSEVYRPFWTRQQAAVRAALGDAAFDAAYADGATLTLEEAAVAALAVEHPDLAMDSDRFQPA